MPQTVGERLQIYSVALVVPGPAEPEVDPALAVRTLAKLIFILGPMASAFTNAPIVMLLALLVILATLFVGAATCSRLPSSRRRRVREFLEMVLPYRKPPP
jgi:hypothetical protein